MAESSPFGLTNENQSFDDLRSESDGLNTQISSNDVENRTLSDDDNNSVRNLNSFNQNRNSAISNSSRANVLGTNFSSGIIGDSRYFNYRGVNGKNFVDPNFVDTQHILTVDAIIDYFNKYPALKMKYTHFAYLKKLGVYPNNRLIVARRYSSPTVDDMFSTSQDTMAPIATVVSWMDPKESLLELSFNEKWEDATESLIDIFKDILSNDVGINLDPPMPLPGFTVGLQYGIMHALGLTNADSSNIPQGNPNLIHETKRRRVPGDDLGGSGLESDFKIKMVCEYQQLYIGKVDPTIGYLDVIGNLLMMGTSNEEFLLTGQASSELQTLFDLAKEGSWIELAKLVIDKIVAGIGFIVDKMSNLLSDSPTTEGGGNYETEYEDTGDPSQQDVANGFKSGVEGFKSNIDSLGDAILSGIFSKYREKLQAAIASMSGLPNGPWHIMIGNPKNPFFVSGDMICKSVSIDFKSELGYNDLPAEYTATLEFEPARNHGIDGIGSKLNGGKGRIYGKAPKDSTGENGKIGNSKGNVQSNNNTANKTN